MITFVNYCPYCMKDASFHSFGINFYLRTPEEESANISLAATCQLCQMPVVAYFHLFFKAMFKDIEIQKIKEKNDSRELYPLTHIKNITEITVLPCPPDPEIPEHLPDDVLPKMRAAESIYLQARGNNDLLEPAGTAYRKALELALKYLDDHTDKNLNWRINHLVKEQVLVKSMGDFAHRVRLLGNDATHDEISLEKLTELRLFMRLFLQYAFTLPAMIPEDVKEQTSTDV